MTHQMLPGSWELDGTVATVGVHTGPSEWQAENLRYIRADISKGDPKDTLISFLGRVYDNSEGCVLRGNFRMKESV